MILLKEKKIKNKNILEVFQAQKFLCRIGIYFIPHESF